VSGSFVIRLIAVFLSVLSLSTAALSAAEITVPADPGQTCQDDAGSLALVGHQALPLLYRAETYLFHEERETFRESSPIFRHTYRGPPSIF
jgi:hypothetical protein